MGWCLALRKLLIDNSLGEIYGPCVMGDAEPDKRLERLPDGLRCFSVTSIQ